MQCRRLSRQAAASPSTAAAAGLRRLATDLRHALRVFPREPLFALTFIAILAIGVGGNVAVFSYANTHLLTSLPVPEPDRVVRVYGRTQVSQFDVVSYPDYLDIDAAAASVDLAAHAESMARVGPADQSDMRMVGLVSGNFFSALRLAPAAGRLLEARDDLTEGAHPVVVLSEPYWRAHFGADPAIVGRSLLIADQSFQIIGIAPSGFRGVYSTFHVDVWVPIAMQGVVRPRNSSRMNRNWGWLTMIGRLADDTSLIQTVAELDAFAASRNAGLPDSSRSTFHAVVASPTHEAERDDVGQMFLLAAAMTTLLLCVACANLAGLLQARLVSRRRELAIRQALGAGRRRIAMSWLVECAVLSLAGGIAGLLVGRGIVSFIANLRPPAELVRELTLDAGLDVSVVLFAALLSIAIAVGFALVPLIGSGSLRPGATLKEEGQVDSGGRRGARIRKTLLVVQASASVTLLVLAGLFLLSARRLQTADTGFDTKGLAIAEVDLGRRRLTAAESAPLIDRALDRLRVVPGISAVAATSTVPLSVAKDRLQVRIPGFTLPGGAKSAGVNFAVVSASYFQTMAIPLTRGATWTASFAAPAPPSEVVINETMARRYWPAADALGHTIEIVGEGTLRVVGIARDSIYYRLGEAPLPFMYLPAEGVGLRSFALLLRRPGPSSHLRALLARELGAVDARLAPGRVGEFEELREIPLYPLRAIATTATVFGVLAMLLTAVGLFGMLSASVGQRTREIGVRIALGAYPGRVLGGVLRDAIALLTVGAIGGLVGAYFAASALAGWFFGVGAFEAPIYTAAVAVVIALALAAAWIPARRAAAIDPVVALRS